MASVAQSAASEPAKQDVPAGEEGAGNNVEDSVAGDEEEEDMEDEGADDGDQGDEEVLVVNVGSTYPCKRADGSQHDAEIVKTRYNKQAGREEYYVHYVGLNRRQNEWVDKSRLVLTKPPKEGETNGTDQEETNSTEQPDSKTPQKRKLEEPEPEPKKAKVEEKDASKNASTLGAAGDFAEELTCPLCMELFKDPVMVACGHNFCRSCIDKAWEGQSSFACPECKESITDRKYTINRVLANLVKKAVCATPVTPVEKKTQPLEKCSEHDERLKLYCKDDGTLGCVICRDSLKHASHNFLPILDAVGVYREELSAIVAPLEASLKVTEQLSSEQSEKIDQHNKNMSQYKEHITSEFEKLHAFLREREEKLLEQLKEQGESLLKEMENNLVKMQENQDAIKKTITLANERMEDTDSISFLMDIKTFIDKCQEQQRAVVSTGNTLLSKELCQGTFKGPIQYIMWKELKSLVVPSLTPMLLDPNSAHPNLHLSEGLTSVRYGENKLSLPDNAKRFSQCILVLGSQGFESGRHYWEVEVGDKTAWDVGMASESSNRKGKIKLNPKNGYWAIWLRNGNAYKALESPSKALTLASHPRKIGVYVDYEGGQISFYNADDMTSIYTFSATFTEKLYPYLSPFLHDGGKNVDALRFVHN
ncbi:Nuclear factor 7 [Xenopus tropicalis]|uniref:Nuclear factor 7 n=2 Tax=Xenopus tropicalis TaxID=8364 RepID=A0A803KJ23_XENTR|nr:Nuclear factor 7 [Xenopus tropicalis]AAI66279.1 Unknown (protein for MGC:185544) [Xenopus tropicalis]|eukprot:NP_001165007.1 Nuclear factor 7 [Xenopus tropicalis]